MVYQASVSADTAPSQIHWRGTSTGNRLDCETGVLLRSLLEPVFQQATSWGALRHNLSRKGFELAFYMGRLVLTDRDSGARICSCKFLGYPLKSLSNRLGRAKVLASCDGKGRGTLLD